MDASLQRVKLQQRALSRVDGIERDLKARVVKRYTDDMEKKKECGLVHKGFYRVQQTARITNDNSYAELFIEKR